MSRHRVIPTLVHRLPQIRAVSNTPFSMAAINRPFCLGDMQDQ
jgi:hypothetical protein